MAGVAAALMVSGAAPGQSQDTPPPSGLAVDPARLRALQAQTVPLQDFSQLRPVIAQDDPVPEGRRLAQIDWDAAIADQRRQQSFPQSATVEVATFPQPAPIAERSENNIRPVRLPVLLPRWGSTVFTRPGGEPGVMLITRSHVYDASWYETGLSVHVSGTRVINHVGEGVRSAMLDRGRGSEGVRIQRDEGGLTADFSRYGAAYTLSLECESRTDPRCADEMALRQLIAGLVVAGGSPDGEG